MTGPRPRPTAAPDPRLTLTSSTPVEEWCADCKAFTRVTARLLVLTADGVGDLGPWTWCEVCDDPDQTLPDRRTCG
ncbi:hypothetical protein [Streptomyces sp. NPDC057250]|uniref:hypothetical protein n=1 Tax=Streptomyces sp. NPDC057250 TaxID=3346068 RepID=UPI00362F4954